MSKEFNEAVGKRIRILRSIKGYSREETAFQASISVKFLYEIEHGKRGISSEKLVKLADVLETSCDFLLLGKIAQGEKNESLNEELAHEFWKKT